MTLEPPTAAPLISVVICTRNRAPLLDDALASVVAQDFPKTDYDIVVVDNGSSDDTADVAARHAKSATLHYVREERIGLCIARNTGWRVARGRYIAYFDDDARAHPGWLSAIARAFAQGPANLGVLGGRVDPVWLAPRPSWLCDNIAGSLTIVDWGPQEKPITDLAREWLVGANMALPRTVLEEVGGFHPWLDRVGTNLLSSGDVFLQKAVMARGYTCLYVPDAAIEHLVPATRLSQDWFIKRFYWQGVSDAVMQLIEQRPSPLGRLRMAAARGQRLLGAKRRRQALLRPTADADAFRDKCFAMIDIGYMTGLLGAARH